MIDNKTDDEDEVMSLNIKIGSSRQKLKDSYSQENLRSNQQHDIKLKKIKKKKKQAKMSLKKSPQGQHSPSVILDLSKNFVIKGNKSPEGMPKYSLESTSPQNHNLTFT